MSLRGSICLASLCSVLAMPLRAQVRMSDPFLILNAAGTDPLFTTYAAAPERSRFFADKAYFMDYFSPDHPITYSSQFSGDLAVIWKVKNIVVSRIADFARKPVVFASFPDLAILEYEPFAGLKVQETFLVYSSGTAIIDLHIENASGGEYDFNLYPMLHLPQDSLRALRYDSTANALVLTHAEPLERLVSNLYANRGYPTFFRDALACSSAPESFGGYDFCSLQDFFFAIKRLSKVQAYVTELNRKASGPIWLAALQKNFLLKPGASAEIRFVRGVQDARLSEPELMGDVRRAMDADLQGCVDRDVELFRRVPRLAFRSPGEKLVYLGAFNLVRQSMLPPEGEAHRNFYVFSRNPQWGWGHGHQVMHESLSMIPYAYLNPQSAEESQRIFIDQQYDDGLIAYRVGPRGPQVYPHEGKATTSAPFFSWTNWEIYKVSKDRAFLKDAYESGEKFIRYMEKDRDKDHDGMYEWGPYGIIENVRDGWNVVFQLFSGGEDEGRDISGELDALDLTTQMANEMYNLSLMARELADTTGERMWRTQFDRTAGLINRYMWDPKDKFYYHIAMSDHSFAFEGESLKRKEIIGFLPMWAHVATKEQARELVKHLLDRSSFWRTYGIPTLAANDSGYTAYVDGCCRWDGPVWLLWDYMVIVGLENYGYKDIARKVADKILLAVTTQLRNNHRFWESYSPDVTQLESPPNYIWDSIMAKVIIDVSGK